VWEWAKKVFTPDDLESSLFLASDFFGRTAWYVAAQRGYAEVLDQLWEWAKEVRTQQEINKTFFINKDVIGNTAWHVAAEKAKLDILRHLWDRAKEVLSQEELRKLLLAKYRSVRTDWYIAAEDGNVPKLSQRAFELLNKVINEHLSLWKIIN
jgi:ankyrin repeat protein